MAEFAGEGFGHFAFRLFEALGFLMFVLAILELAKSKLIVSLLRTSNNYNEQPGKKVLAEELNERSIAVAL